MTGKELESVFRQMDIPIDEIDVLGDRAPFIVVLASSAFRRQNEARRQAQVWRHLHDKLPEYGSLDVEFVFTMTPEEFQERQKKKPAA